MPIKINHDPEPTLNLTPMIDIVFLLIIFFMVGTKFAELERQIKVELPKSSNMQALSPIPKQRVVNVYRDNTIMMEGQAYSLDELLSELKRVHTEQSETKLLIRGDGQGALQNITSVLTACRSAGFDRLGIGVQAETIRR